ncbi:aromatic acid exporter family protein [Paenibacillus turicensis]|uniref:FUSC family protein n=1 Tax=Paenibacillus turicensis TaxID=160487 RepID=UPI003D2D66EE
MKYTIGMRNIKTAIAIFITVMISALLKLEYPFYAAIATIISMENSVTNSYTAGRNRMMGTCVGAGIGLIFAWIKPHDALFCAIGIVIVIYICNLLKWNKSISIASIVFLAIMLNLKPGESSFYYGINRIFDTLIGVSVAVLVNYLIFPPKHEFNLHVARKALMKNLVAISNQVLYESNNSGIKELKKEISNLEKHYSLCKQEFHLKKDLSALMNQIQEEIDIINHIYAHMRMIQRLHGEPGVQSFLTQVQSLDTSSQDIVVDYHMQCILQELHLLGISIPEPQQNSLP